jgi:hypothetical protein
MNIKTEFIESLKDPVLLNTKNNYPQSKNTFLPKNYSVMLIAGSRGSGKSYSLVKLIRQMELAGTYDKFGNKMGIRTILFSPTYEANPIFNSLQSLDEDDVYKEYSDTVLKDIISEIAKEKQESTEYKLNLQAYKRFIKMKNPINLSSDELLRLYALNFEAPEKIEFENGRVVNLVFDDLVGSEIYKPSGKSYFRNLLLRNRHVGVNIYMLVQNMKSVPKSIRINCSVFVLFKFSNKKILEDLHDEVGSTITLDNFSKLYNFATESEHDALVIDFTNEKKYRFKRNFNEILSLN